MERLVRLEDDFRNFPGRKGRFVKRLDEAPVDAVGDRIFGRYDSVKNRIILYKDYDLRTIAHELLHFEQAKFGKRVGRNLIDTPIQRKMLERDILWKLRQLGFDLPESLFR